MQTIQKQLNAWPLLSINLPSNWEDNIQIKTTEEPSKVTCEQYVLIPQEKQVFSDSPSGRINWYKPLPRIPAFPFDQPCSHLELLSFWSSFPLIYEHR